MASSTSPERRMTSRRSSRAERRMTSAWPTRSMADAGTKARRRPTRMTRPLTGGYICPSAQRATTSSNRPISWPVWFRTGRPSRPANDTMESNTPSEARMRRVRRRRWCGGRSASRERPGIRRERFGVLVDGGVAMELPPVASSRERSGRSVVWWRARGTRASAIGACLRTTSGLGATARAGRGSAAARSGACAVRATGGFALRHGHTSFSVFPVREGISQDFPTGHPTGRAGTDGAPHPGAARTWGRVP